MDPLAVLNAEIARKRKAASDALPAATASAAAALSAVKKYKRRGDIEAEREAEERRRGEEARRKAEEEEAEKKRAKEQEQQRLASLQAPQRTGTPGAGGRATTPDTTRVSPSPAGTPGRSGTPLPAAATAPTNPDALISSAEVVRRLRARGEPIRLFGESDAARTDRLRLVESQEEKVEGQRNEFMRALEATDKRLAMETIQRGAGVVDEEALRRRAREEAELEGVDTTPICVDLLMKDPERTYHLLSVYFRRLFMAWEKDLESRSDEDKRSNEGKKREAMFRQTTDYMRPFFKALSSKNLDADVVARISEIADWLQKREYQRANNAYLTLSIGNAPWPIGVTMVGIHERSAREKIFAAQVAHVLNDETTRKWIQSLKRLMSWMQDKYPPADLSKRMG
ncbi:Prp18-domain-containing protein [Gonapodya prolifera JEL478]|uniref:Pre-mRNA-splicing factor 18 n=1 Tax=Gonapodya prolifera (strain JEL478) TaxID=1344416 RepID=A0A139ARN1_GONPJ|nr:Prp18-domain-containing protein [Gonapodya prolifera JEL478]|eukprot:KXS19183.1 Prp18-domain-containing protein [Gonapodya prolifera JEL478]